MTEPILDQKTPFSIVVRVRILSLPGRPTPMVIVELSRRVWATSLRPSYLVRRLTGYAFPSDRHTALPFTLELARQGNGQGAGWSYEPDRDLAPITRAFDLPSRLSGADILARGHLSPECRLLVVHKNGVGRRVAAKYGIPDADKLIAFQRVAETLVPSGFHEWQALAKVETRMRPVQSQDQWWHDPDRNARRKRHFEQRRAAETEAIEAHYAGIHSIVIGFDPHVSADAERAQATLLRLLGDRVRIERIALPVGVHGPRALLNGAQLRNDARAEQRAESWRPFVAEVRRYLADKGTRLDGLLILAPEWYEERHDDIINKRSGRITLARHLGIPVQYLRPVEDNWALRRDDDPVQYFERRLLIAWRDLIWKTIGRIKETQLRHQIEFIYGKTPDVQPPDRVVAVGVLRRNTTRALFNEGSFVPFAIELDVEQGTCEARFARERGMSVEATPRLPLPEALALLALSGPIHLATDPTGRQEQRRERAQRFFHEVITDVCQRAKRPLVLIDAVTCRDVWPWVADTRLDPSNVLIGSHPHAEADWGDTRIVRLRIANAPKVLWDGVVEATGTVTGDVIRYEVPESAEATRFRVTDTPTPVYFSFGSLLRTGMVAGVSCYRPIVTLKRQSVDGHFRYTRLERGPWTNAWSTPNAVELAVVRTAPGENPDQLAQYVEVLRTLFGHTSGWTIKPAPLHFENAMREYLADYSLDEETEEDTDAASDDVDHEADAGDAEEGDEDGEQEA